MSAAQGDMDVQPVDIHNKICRFSLLPYPYKATILCFSNFVLFQQLLHVCKCPLKGKAFVLGLSLLVSTIWVPHRSVHWSHTVHEQLVHKPGIYQIKQFYLPLSELLTLHPLQILLQFLLWCSADGCKSKILFSYVLMICHFVLTQQIWKRVRCSCRWITQQLIEEQDLEQTHRSLPVCDQWPGQIFIL